MPPGHGPSPAPPVTLLGAPAAVGDGVADDAAAIQKAFDGVATGSVLYFPAGTYRLTATLTLRLKF